MVFNLILQILFVKPCLRQSPLVFINTSGLPSEEHLPEGVKNYEGKGLIQPVVSLCLLMQLKIHYCCNFPSHGQTGTSDHVKKSPEINRGMCAGMQS